MAPSMKRRVATAALVLGRHRVCLAKVLADHLQRVSGDGDGLVVGEPAQVARFWRSQPIADSEKRRRVAPTWSTSDTVVQHHVTRELDPRSYA
jgi:hypothetical protein